MVAAREKRRKCMGGPQTTGHIEDGDTALTASAETAVCWAGAIDRAPYRVAEERGT